MSLAVPEQQREELQMYFTPEVAAAFAAKEQNEDNRRVAESFDRIIEGELSHLPDPLHVAELGGGAHPDRYNRLFARLQNTNGTIDWVDISPHMLELAEHYLDEANMSERREVIAFIENDIFEYLHGIDDNSLNAAIMKNTFDHIEFIEDLIPLLSKKLQPGGKLIATYKDRKKLRNGNPHAHFFYNGERVPDDEDQTLEHGESFTLKFFKETGNPNAGYIEGAEITKYYHAPEKITEIAEEDFIVTFKQEEGVDVVVFEKR